MNPAEAAAKKQQERETLRNVIAQWNANRLDLFELSEPNEDLEFHGVMRFYFQDSGQKVATKCIRVASDATTQAVIETLIEKFRADMRMLSLPEYALYEIHENGDERRLGMDEKPLLVQLNWHMDDREGRFLLRRIDDKTHMPSVGFSQESASSFRRKLSKREKKQLKKQEKINKLKSAAPINENDSGVAEKLYIELPETSFTRSISNPEAVMRRRRQQKLERKLQQFRSKDGGPDTGGTLKIYGESLCQDVPYKTLLLSVRDTAQQVVKEMLAKYGLEKEMDPHNYCLVQVNAATAADSGESKEYHGGTNNREYILDDDECPLAILMNHPLSRGSIMFHVRRRPADYHPRKRKKKLQQKWNKGNELQEYRYEDGLDRLPFFLELNPDGTDINNGTPKKHQLHPNVTEVGSERLMNVAGSQHGHQSQSLQLFGPNVQSRHCVIANTEGIVTVTPCSGNAETYVNGQRIYETTILQNGAVVKFGRIHNFRFLDPSHDDRTRQRHDSARQPLDYNFDRQSSREDSVSHGGTSTSCQNINNGTSQNYETTFDVDGNVETVSTSSLGNKDETRSQRSVSSSRDGNRLSNYERYPRGTDPILPAVLEFREETEEAFLHAVISDLDPQDPYFKLAPTYTLYLVARYRASTHYRPELTPTERAHRLTVLLARVAAIIHTIIQERYAAPKSLAFWMANSSELLHFLKSDRHISAFSLDAQDILSECVQIAFRNLVSCLQGDVAAVMPQFMSEREENLDDENTRSVLQVLTSTMALLRRCRVNAALTIQLFSQLFHFVNMWAFNKVVTFPTSPHVQQGPHNICYCTKAWGIRLKTRLARLEAWAERQGLELAADCHLARIIQAAHLLQAPKYNAEDLSTLSSTCFKLNSLQLRALLSMYQSTPEEPRLPQELIENVVRVAENVADELARSDGREIRLEEDAELQLPFLLPEDGYSCDVVRGVPQGLAEFLAPLQQAGLCRMTTQPTSSGLWTIYMTHDHNTSVRSPSSMSNRSDGARCLPSHPEVHVIKLHKSASGMGLSIVAAKGAGQDKLGIYIKSVVKGGAADVDGQLQAGDQLLKVDGQSLVGITQEKAAEYLVRTGSVVVLEVGKQGAIYHGLATLLQQPSPVMTRAATTSFLYHLQSEMVSSFHNTEKSPNKRSPSLPSSVNDSTQTILFPQLETNKKRLINMNIEPDGVSHFKYNQTIGKCQSFDNLHVHPGIDIYSNSSKYLNPFEKLNHTLQSINQSQAKLNPLGHRKHSFFNEDYCNSKFSFNHQRCDKPETPLLTHALSKSDTTFLNNSKISTNINERIQDHVCHIFTSTKPSLTKTCKHTMSTNNHSNNMGLNNELIAKCELSFQTENSSLSSGNSNKDCLGFASCCLNECCSQSSITTLSDSFDINTSQKTSADIKPHSKIGPKTYQPEITDLNNYVITKNDCPALFCTHINKVCSQNQIEVFDKFKKIKVVDKKLYSNFEKEKEIIEQNYTPEIIVDSSNTNVDDRQSRLDPDNLNDRFDSKCDYFTSTMLNLDLSSIKDDDNLSIGSFSDTKSTKCWKSPEEVRLGYGRVAALAKHFSNLGENGLSHNHSIGMKNINGNVRINSGYTSSPDISTRTTVENMFLNGAPRLYNETVLPQSSVDDNIPSLLGSTYHMGLNSMSISMDDLLLKKNVTKFKNHGKINVKEDLVGKDKCKISDTTENLKHNFNKIKAQSNVHKSCGVHDDCISVSYGQKEYSIFEFMSKSDNENPHTELTHNERSKSEDNILRTKFTCGTQTPFANRIVNPSFIQKKIVGLTNVLNKSCSNDLQNRTQSENNILSLKDKRGLGSFNTETVNKIMPKSITDNECRNGQPCKLEKQVKNEDTILLLRSNINVCCPACGNTCVHPHGRREDKNIVKEWIPNIEVTQTVIQDKRAHQSVGVSPFADFQIRNSPRRMSERDLPSRIQNEHSSNRDHQRNLPPIQSSKSVPSLSSGNSELVHTPVSPITGSTDSSKQHEVFNPGYSRTSSTNSIPQKTFEAQPQCAPVSGLRSKSNQNLHDPRQGASLSPTGAMSRQSSNPTLHSVSHQQHGISSQHHINQPQHPSLGLQNQPSYQYHNSLAQNQQAGEVFYQNLSMHRNEESYHAYPPPSPSRTKFPSPQAYEERSPTHQKKNLRGSQSSLHRPPENTSGGSRDRPASSYIPHKETFTSPQHGQNFAPRSQSTRDILRQGAKLHEMQEEVRRRKIDRDVQGVVTSPQHYVHQPVNSRPQMVQNNSSHRLLNSNNQFTNQDQPNHQGPMAPQSPGFPQTHPMNSLYAGSRPQGNFAPPTAPKPTRQPVPQDIQRLPFSPESRHSTHPELHQGPLRPPMPPDELGYRDSPPPPPPPTSTHPLYQSSQKVPPQTGYSASMGEPPKGTYYPASTPHGSANQQPIRQYQFNATNPWEREEREKEQQRRRDAARAWRDHQIAELSNLSQRSPQQEEQLRALKLEKEFQKRAEEAAHQDEDEEGEDDQESLERVQGLLRITSEQQHQDNLGLTKQKGGRSLASWESNSQPNGTTGGPLTSVLSKTSLVHLNTGNNIVTDDKECTKRLEEIRRKQIKVEQEEKMFREAAKRRDEDLRHQSYLLQSAQHQTNKENINQVQNVGPHNSQHTQNTNFALLVRPHNQGHSTLTNPNTVNNNNNLSSNNNHILNQYSTPLTPKLGDPSQLRLDNLVINGPASPSHHITFQSPVSHQQYNGYLVTKSTISNNGSSFSNSYQHEQIKSPPAVQSHRFDPSNNFYENQLANNSNEPCGNVLQVQSGAQRLDSLLSLNDQGGNNTAPQPPERGSSFTVMSQTHSVLRNSSNTISGSGGSLGVMPTNTSSTLKLSDHGHQGVGTATIKRVSFHDPNANQQTQSQTIDQMKEDPNHFINEAEGMLSSPKSPDSGSFLANTPGVIGAQEVYKDPRTRMLAQQQQQKSTRAGPLPEKLSFKEKMKMFAMETGENGTPRDKVKISRAQREIDGLSTPTSPNNSN